MTVSMSPSMCVQNVGCVITCDRLTNDNVKSNVIIQPYCISTEDRKLKCGKENAMVMERNLKRRKPQSFASENLHCKKPRFRRKLIEKYSTRRYNINTKFVNKESLKKSKIRTKLKYKKTNSSPFTGDDPPLGGGSNSNSLSDHCYTSVDGCVADSKSNRSDEVKSNKPENWKLIPLDFYKYLAQRPTVYETSLEGDIENSMKRKVKRRKTCIRLTKKKVTKNTIGNSNIPVCHDPYLDSWIENYQSDSIDYSDGKVGILTQMGVRRPLFPLIHRNIVTMCGKRDSEITSTWAEFALSTLVTEDVNSDVKIVLLPVVDTKLMKTVANFSQQWSRPLIQVEIVKRRIKTAARCLKRRISDSKSDCDINIDFNSVRNTQKSIPSVLDFSHQYASYPVKKKHEQISKVGSTVTSVGGGSTCSLCSGTTCRTNYLKDGDKPVLEFSQADKSKSRSSCTSDNVPSFYRKTESQFLDTKPKQSRTYAKKKKNDFPVTVIPSERVLALRNKKQLLEKAASEKLSQESSILRNHPARRSLFAIRQGLKKTQQSSQGELEEIARQNELKPCWVVLNKVKLLDFSNCDNSTYSAKKSSWFKDPVKHKIPQKLHHHLTVNRICLTPAKPAISEMEQEEDESPEKHFFGYSHCTRTFGLHIDFVSRNRSFLYAYKMRRTLRFQQKNNKYFQSGQYGKIQKIHECFDDVNVVDKVDETMVDDESRIVNFSYNPLDMLSMPRGEKFGVSLVKELNTKVAFPIHFVDNSLLKRRINCKWLILKFVDDIQYMIVGKHVLPAKVLFEVMYRADLTKKIVCNEIIDKSCDVMLKFGLYGIPSICNAVFLGPYPLYEKFPVVQVALNVVEEDMKYVIVTEKPFTDIFLKEDRNIVQTSWWQPEDIYGTSINSKVAYLHFLFSPPTFLGYGCSREKIVIADLMNAHSAKTYIRYQSLSNDINYVLIHDFMLTTLVGTEWNSSRRTVALERELQCPVKTHEDDSMISAISKKVLPPYAKRMSLAKNDQEIINANERERRRQFRCNKENLRSLLKNREKLSSLVSVMEEAKNTIVSLTTEEMNLIQQKAELRQCQRKLLKNSWKELNLSTELAILKSRLMPHLTGLRDSEDTEITLLQLQKRLKGQKQPSSGIESSLLFRKRRTPNVNQFQNCTPLVTVQSENTKGQLISSAPTFKDIKLQIASNQPKLNRKKIEHFYKNCTTNITEVNPWNGRWDVQQNSEANLNDHTYCVIRKLPVLQDHSYVANDHSRQFRVRNYQSHDSSINNNICKLRTIHSPNNVPYGLSDNGKSHDQISVYLLENERLIIKLDINKTKYSTHSASLCPQSSFSQPPPKSEIKMNHLIQILLETLQTKPKKDDIIEGKTVDFQYYLSVLKKMLSISNDNVNSTSNSGRIIKSKDENNCIDYYQDNKKFSCRIVSSIKKDESWLSNIVKSDAIISLSSSLKITTRSLFENIQSATCPLACEINTGGFVEKSKQEGQNNSFPEIEEVFVNNTDTKFPYDTMGMLNIVEDLPQQHRSRILFPVARLFISETIGFNSNLSNLVSQPFPIFHTIEEIPPSGKVLENDSSIRNCINATELFFNKINHSANVGKNVEDLCIESIHDEVISETEIEEYIESHVQVLELVQGSEVKDTTCDSGNKTDQRSFKLSVKSFASLHYLNSSICSNITKLVKTS